MTPMVEPFTHYWFWDLVRVAIVPAALLQCALVARLAVRRWRSRRTDRYRQQTHPAVMLSYAACLLLIAVRRIDNLGTPFSWYVVPSLAVLALGYWGVLSRVDVRLPWRRPR